MAFDKQAHARDLLKVEGIICDASLLSDGMSIANNGMDDTQYARMADGAFGLLSRALDDAFETISEAESTFVYENDITRGAEANG